MSMHSVYINDKAADLFRLYIYEIIDRLHMTRSEFADLAGSSRQMLHSYIKYKTPIRVTAFNSAIFTLMVLTTNLPLNNDVDRIWNMIHQMVDASGIRLQISGLDLSTRQLSSYVSKKCPPIDDYWTIAQYQHLCEMNRSEINTAIRRGYVKVTKINGHNYIPKSQPYLKVVRKRPGAHPGIPLEFVPAEEKGE